jgi:alanine racemase
MERKMLSRETYIEINIKNYMNNLKSIEKITESIVIPVIKSNAYGCGAVEIAKVSEKAGIDFMAVAFLEEAENLRKNGIQAKLLIFNMISHKFIEKAVNQNFIISIYSIEQIKKYLRFNKKETVKLKYNININTGINNLGVNLDEIDELIKIIKENLIEIEGIYTHFSSADSDMKNTRKQYELLKKAEEIIKKAGVNFKYKHAANSAATILRKKEYFMDYVRSGMALYGIQPSNIKKAKWIKNVITWKSSISNVRVIKAGETLNYGKNFKALKEMRIAVIPVGYGDGYKMGMKNGGYVIIKNKKCYIKGMVCMDQITVEIPNELEVNEEDEAILLGGSGENRISVEEAAGIAGTIPDDIICSISKEIPRVYIK